MFIWNITGTTNATDLGSLGHVFTTELVLSFIVPTKTKNGKFQTKFVKFALIMQMPLESAMLVHCVQRGADYFDHVMIVMSFIN